MAHGQHAGGGQGGEDETLLARIRGRDQAAFRLLADRHMPRILTLARRMLRDPSEADDVAQETFLRLWRNASGLTVGPAGLAPWLRQVASNLCLDRLRARGRLEVTDEVPEAVEPATQLAGLEKAELKAKVDAALAGLAERQRVALTLFHYEGMSMAEVGAIMGVSEEAVESLLARARRALKGALAEEWASLKSSAGGGR